MVLSSPQHHPSLPREKEKAREKRLAARESSFCSRGPLKRRERETTAIYYSEICGMRLRRRGDVVGGFSTLARWCMQFLMLRTCNMIERVRACIRERVCHSLEKNRSSHFLPVAVN